jgi:hypothetical protein
MGFEDNIERELASLPEAKPWWRSKIILINLTALIVAALADNIEALQGHLPGSVYAWLCFLLPPVNIFLRFLTKLGVRL